MISSFIYLIILTFIAILIEILVLIAYITAHIMSIVEKNNPNEIYKFKMCGNILVFTSLGIFFLSI